MYVHIHILLSMLLLAENFDQVCRYPGIHNRQYLTSEFSLFSNEITFLHSTHFPPQLLSFFPSFLIVKLLQACLKKGFDSDLVNMGLTGILNSQ